MSSRIIPAYAGSTAGARAYTPSRPGSSPHTRGALVVGELVAGERRIIPAYAGSTFSACTGCRTPPDHPRIRGEHVRELRVAHTDVGSSPHTRGARLSQLHHLIRSGIIPAYAGSTIPSRRRRGRRADHPRIRGEHLAHGEIMVGETGSSPHTRGAPSGDRDIYNRPRIIPAYAGSTHANDARGPGEADHPRIRGEHVYLDVLAVAVTGSSPHTRGARGASLDRWHAARIIPAYAGSTFDSEFLWGPGTDHPRIRGEHGGCQAILVDSDGSSPHTRGAPDRRQARQPRDGIIPAYAGSTESRTTTRTSAPDHPRIRGEHEALEAGADGGVGSSPHTRGAQTPQWFGR